MTIIKIGFKIFFLSNTEHTIDFFNYKISNLDFTYKLKNRNMSLNYFIEVFEDNNNLFI